MDLCNVTPSSMSSLITLYLCFLFPDCWACQDWSYLWVFVVLIFCPFWNVLFPVFFLQNLFQIPLSQRLPLITEPNFASPLFFFFPSSCPPVILYHMILFHVYSICLLLPGIISPMYLLVYCTSIPMNFKIHKSRDFCDFLVTFYNRCCSSSTPPLMSLEAILEITCTSIWPLFYIPKAFHTFLPEGIL